MAAQGGGQSGQTFANLVVNFSTTGWQAVVQQVTTLSTNITNVAGVARTTGQAVAGAAAGMVSSLAGAAAWAGKLGLSFVTGMGNLGPQLTRGLEGMSQAFQGLGKVVTPATMAIYGFALAGFRASSYGQIFGYQMEEIARQVGSIFLPVIQRVTDGLGSLMRWFQGLSGAQQKSLREWGLLAGGITAAALVLPRVVAGFQAVQVAAKGLQLALTSVAAANPWLLVVAGLGAAIASTMTLQEATQLFVDVSKVIADPFRDLLALIKDIGAELRGAATWAKELAGATDKSKGKDDKGIMGWAGDNLNPFANQQAMVEKLFGEKASKSIASRILSLSPTGGFATGLRLFTPWLDGAKAYDRKPGDEARGDLMPRIGQFESVEQTYKRITEASIKVTGDVKGPAEESRDYLKEIMETAKRLDATVKALKPGVV